MAVKSFISLTPGQPRLLTSTLTKKFEPNENLVEENEGQSWTNFRQQDKTWAKFSTVEVAVRMLFTFHKVYQ